MRITIILLSFFLIISFAKGQHTDCDTILYPSPTLTTWLKAGSLGTLKPGFKVCLAPGKYFQIRIDSLAGNPSGPVKIVPQSDSVTIESGTNYGIRFGKSKNIQLLGSTIPSKYGIIIRDISGMGISVDDLSTDIEIAGVFIDSVSFSGIVAKTNPDCSLTSVRGAFLLKNLFIHDNYIRRTGNEGMYIGHTFYGGYTINCNGHDTVVLPHLLQNVDIYNNLLEECGFDAIQVSCATNGCYIHHNTIRHDSRDESYGQMSGINIGGGTVAECYNNLIENGKGMGIEVHGLGNTLIYNNLIIKPGLNYKPGQHIQYSKSGIFIGELYSKPDLTPIHIFNNTIISPKSDGIRQTSNLVSGCRIQNNAIINPGIYDYYLANNIPTERAYVSSVAESNSIVSNNFCSQDIMSPLFQDTIHNFRLQSGSPLIDAGIDLTAFGIDSDFDDNPRPRFNGYDIGCYEYQNSAGVNEIKNTQNQIRCRFIKSGDGKTALEIKLKTGMNLSVTIYDLSGKTLYRLPEKNYKKGTEIIDLDGFSRFTGFVVVSLIGEGTKQSIKLFRH